MLRTVTGWLVVLLSLVSPGGILAQMPDAKGVEFFEKKIRPVFVEKCYSCHSESPGAKVRGDLRLDTRAGVLKGGTTGPSLVPGEPEKSLLLQAVRQTGDLKMPPKGTLTKEQIADLEAWVTMGAPDPRDGKAVVGIDLEKGRDFWAFKPVTRPVVPVMKAEAFNEIDRFILAELSRRGLSSSPLADRRTLLRRVSYDLTGLPPTLEEIAAFLADDSPDAYARVVERLLASPAYGQRWGRHWLDVVRYSDTAGDNSDYPIPQMVRYRDWVVDAFNADMPYDRFVREQIAGDLMTDGTEADRRAKLIATGYLANSRRVGSYEDARYQWYLTYEDSIENFGRAFLGLSLGCARCHDHKFDPIPQTDYYALYGFFASTRYPWPGIELDKAPRDLVPLVATDEVRRWEAERRAKLAELDGAVNKLRADMGEKAAIKKAEDEREKYAKQPAPFEMVYAMAEHPPESKKKPGHARLQMKGDPEYPGAEVPRRFPLILGGQVLPSDTPGSGRLHLAKWLTDAKNPLLARVLVNRIWLGHFGRGLVATPNDFGKMGQPPSHPELLEALAQRFIDEGWSIKAMHRLIVHSRTYRQSSAEETANATIDVANTYLWRFPRQRLDAESIRDSLLLLGGNLDRSVGGPHPFPEMKTWNFTQHNPFKAVYETNRRSVYLMTQRIQRHPFLALFDGPDTNASTASRLTSTTPLQGLFLLNDPFAQDQAKRFALRLMSEPDEARRVDLAYLLAFARPPSKEERSAVVAHAAKVREKLPKEPAKTWESVARALLLSNEFVYID